MKLAPVSSERLQRALTTGGIPFQVDDEGDVSLASPKSIAVFRGQGPHFAALYQWVGRATTKEGREELRAAVNEVNGLTTWIHLHLTSVDNLSFVKGMASFPLTEGVTDEQLSNMVGHFLLSADALSDFLAERVGHLAMYPEGDH